jgi:hypothetical protein
MYDLIARAAIVDSTSQIRSSAMFLLPIVGN